TRLPRLSTANVCQRWGLAAIPGACRTVVGMTKHGHVLRFHEIDRSQVALVGGKGAHLAELSRVEGVRVPPGFCVTTQAFERFMEGAPSIGERLERLSRLRPDDHEAI